MFRCQKPQKPFENYGSEIETHKVGSKMRYLDNIQTRKLETIQTPTHELCSAEIGKLNTPVHRLSISVEQTLFYFFKYVAFKSKHSLLLRGEFLRIFSMLHYLHIIYTECIIIPSFTPPRIYDKIVFIWWWRDVVQTHLHLRSRMLTAWCSLNTWHHAEERNKRWFQIVNLCRFSPSIVNSTILRKS